MKTYKILVSCGSGIATSTVIANRVKKLCEDNEIDVSIKQVKIVEVEKLAPDYDLIVSNTVKTPSIFAISYLTGVNQEATDKEVVSKLKHIVEK
jgi:PTS system galactitol-specific IIB component